MYLSLASSVKKTNEFLLTINVWEIESIAHSQTNAISSAIWLSSR